MFKIRYRHRRRTEDVRELSETGIQNMNGTTRTNIRPYSLNSSVDHRDDADLDMESGRCEEGMSTVSWTT